MSYALYFFIAVAISVVCVPYVKKLSSRLGTIDDPDGKRKIHKKPMPLMGGLAVYVAVVLTTVFYLIFGEPNFQVIPLKFIVGMLLAGGVLIVGGYFDDKYNLSAKVTILFPLLACFIAVASGIGVGLTVLTNPLGGNINLNHTIVGVPFAAVLSFVWLMGMTYTTKILDGMDGLVPGIGTIAALTLFFLSLTPKVNQPMTAAFAVILAGAIMGFLVYNFNPASIFLGEGGSTLIGFLLGVLSIILGGKIATALLVMGIPILDVAWAIFRRLWVRSSPFVADRRHLHFRLLDIGLNQRQAVFVLWGISAVFGFTAVFLQSMGKLIALGVVLVVMVVMAVTTVVLYKKRVSSVVLSSDSESLKL